MSESRSAGRPSGARGSAIDPRAGVESLAGIGPRRAEKLAEAGYRRVRDLLFHLPVRYEDRRLESACADIDAPGPRLLRGRLESLSRVFTRRRGARLVRGRLVDATGSLAVVWFNRPYLLEQVEEGSEYLLFGEVRSGRRSESWELVNPSLSRTEASRTGIVPVYPPLAGLGQERLRAIAGRLAGDERLAEWLPDFIPAAMRTERGVPELATALRALHLPQESDDLAALAAGTSPAHHRLVYGELLRLRSRIELARRRVVERPKPHRHRLDRKRRERLLGALPFAPTRAQRRAAEEIWDDLEGATPMQRLLQGDVGCGKTAVALLAILAALENGLQAALMAPTEILAEQHAERLERELGGRRRVGLVTGSAPRGAEARGLASGEIELAVGTHALFQSSLSFRRLGLAVIDEQHRFGLAQRQQLVAKGARPDLLVMTATPIPRSLALTTYGDLDLSIIDEMPPGRGSIETLVLPRRRRREVYRSLREQVRGGSQAFVVLPFIEVSESLDVSALEREGAEVVSWLEGCRCAFVHGRMRSDERREAMARFAAGELDVLVATPVIEVGVDVAAARFMVIESAERFGLAQLHQLRGRVGRGGGESWCVALHGSLAGAAEERLRTFASTRDGFALAEADLEQRGPGELDGARQSGWPQLRAARLPRDLQWLERAREDARRLLDLAATDEAAGAFVASLARVLNERGAPGVTGG